MDATTATAPAARAAFDALIDYAGLFPPATLDVPEATAGYAAARQGPYAWMLGRFIVPLSRVDELLSRSGAGTREEPLPLCVIVDASPDPRSWFGWACERLERIAQLIQLEPRVRVSAIEAPLPPLLTQRETFDGVIGQLGALVTRAGLRALPVYAELPRGPRWREQLTGAMEAMARAGLSAKLRCGGITAQAFPSVEEVAAFVVAAAENGVAFKATAGLHHPLRHVDPATGFPMHGFLNLLAAAAFAPQLETHDVETILAQEDPRAFGFEPDSFRWRDRSVGVDDLRSVRATAFVGYGSCSFSEPTEDLTALGMIAAAR